MTVESRGNKAPVLQHRILDPKNIPGLESSSHPHPTLGLGQLAADSQNLPPPRDFQVPKMQLPGGARTFLDMRSQQAHEITG